MHAYFFTPLINNEKIANDAENRISTGLENVANKKFIDLHYKYYIVFGF